MAADPLTCVVMGDRAIFGRAGPECGESAAPCLCTKQSSRSPKGLVPMDLGTLRAVQVDRASGGAPWCFILFLAFQKNLAGSASAGVSGAFHASAFSAIWPS